MTEPDNDKLDKLAREMEVLFDSGRLTREEFIRIWREAVEATHGNGDEMEPFALFADDEWLEEAEKPYQ